MLGRLPWRFRASALELLAALGVYVRLAANRTRALIRSFGPCRAIAGDKLTRPAAGLGEPFCPQDSAE